MPRVENRAAEASSRECGLGVLGGQREEEKEMTLLWSGMRGGGEGVALVLETRGVKLSLNPALDSAGAQ